MQQDATEVIRAELKRRDADKIKVLPGRSTVPGCFTLELSHADFPMPLGIIWISFTGPKTAYVNNSFVDERFRRCGVRTMLHEKLFEYYPAVNRVLTGGGTESGRAWMKATGYKRSGDLLEYRQPKKRKQPQRRR